MSGFGLNKTVTANVTPSTIVFFDKVTPTTAGVVFDPNTPATTDILYISSVDASTWIWDGSDYVTYAAPSVSSTEWYLYGTTIDAGSNKTASIQRSGAIFVNVDSYFYDVRVGRGNGSIGSNTIVGDKCLLSNTTGAKITAVGAGALQFNTASNNTAVGWGSLTFNSSGTNNTGVGSEALLRNVTGSNNSAIGYQAGEFLANGSTSNTTPENSVFLGYSTRSLTNNDTNQIVIGYLALGKGSNTVQLGNTSITATYLQGEVNINPVSGQISRAIINSDNNVGALLSFRTANLPRWAIRKDGNETGANVGGDLAVRRYDDAGAFIDTPISIKRSTGAVTLNSAYALPTVAPTSGQVLGYLGAGTTQWTTAGLSYFTEAQATASPNNLVYANSLTAVASVASADFIIKPKGVGAFIVGHIPDGTSTNGNKRGTYAVELNPGALAGAVYCATGSRSFSVNGGASNGTDSIAIGRISYALGTGAVNVGGGFATNGATANYSAILGGSDQIATEASGIGAISLGGGYANGYHSLASGFGRATGTGAIALGGAYVASATASGTQSFATGNTVLANSSYAGAFGIYSSTKGISSRMSLGTLQDVSPYVQGNSQISWGIVTIQTTGNTASELLAYGGTAIALVLQNNEAIRVKGSIIGKQTATTNICSYDFDCVIVRGTTAGSTVLKVSNMNLVWDDIIVTTIPSLNADTSNGGLSVKSGGKASTTIKWTASIYSTESILA